MVRPAVSKRHGDPDGRSAVRRTVDRESPAERVQTVAQAKQAGPRRGARAADSVVGNLGVENVSLNLDMHAGRRGLGVSCDVGERLCDGVVDRCLYGRRHPFARHVELYRQRRAVRQAGQGGREPALAQHCGL
jgi:hypothetical protein